MKKVMTIVVGMLLCLSSANAFAKASSKNHTSLKGQKWTSQVNPKVLNRILREKNATAKSQHDPYAVLWKQAEKVRLETNAFDEKTKQWKSAQTEAVLIKNEGEEKILIQRTSEALPAMYTLLQADNGYKAKEIVFKKDHLIYQFHEAIPADVQNKWIVFSIPATTQKIDHEEKNAFYNEKKDDIFYLTVLNRKGYDKDGALSAKVERQTYEGDIYSYVTIYKNNVRIHTFVLKNNNPLTEYTYDEKGNFTSTRSSNLPLKFDATEKRGAEEPRLSGLGCALLMGEDEAGAF